MENQPTLGKPSLFGMILSPGEQFDKMRENPRFWGALIIVALLAGIGMAIGTLGIPDEVFQVPELQLSPEEIGIAKMFGAAGAGLVSFIGVPIGILISAAIMLLITMIAQKNTTYRQLVSLNTYIAFITTIGVLLNGVLGLVTGSDLTTVQMTSLGSIVEAEGALGGLLAGIEVFSIWGTVLTAIGLNKVAGLSKGASWTIAIVFFVIGILFAMAAGSFSGMAGM